MEKNAKIYIAGHKGMVGSAIMRKLEECGYTKLVYASVEQLDLSVQESVRKFFEKENPEYVFLAAAKVGGIMANNTFRAQFIYENLMIQSNIIHQAYKTGVKKLLFLGSSCIYPRNAPQPLKEEYLLTSELEYTNEPYAIAKIAGIKTIEAYNIQYGTGFLSVMPTNLYGPNDNYDLQTSHVLPALVRKMQLAKCLENGDWAGIRKDLQKRSIESIDGTAPEEIILLILKKYGIESNSSNQEFSSNDQNSKSQIPNPKSSFSIPRTLSQEQVHLKLWGSGTPLREFMHVDDLAAACVHIMENVSFVDLAGATVDQQLPTEDQKSTAEHSSTPQSAAIINTHINLGTGVDLSIRELSELIKRIVGFKGSIEWDASKPDGTPRKLMDVSKMKRLGFEPKIGLEEGIRRTYNSYADNE